MLSGARPSVRQPRVGSWSCRMTLHAPQQLAEIKNSSILEAQWSTSVLNGNIQPLVDPARGHWHCHTIGVLQREASIWFLLSGHRIKTTKEAMHFQGFGLWDPFDCLRHCLLKDILLTSQIFCHAERALKQLRCKTVWLFDHFIPFPFPIPSLYVSWHPAENHKWQTLWCLQCIPIAATHPEEAAFLQTTQRTKENASC